jgi:hypothetical protein
VFSEKKIKNRKHLFIPLGPLVSFIYLLSTKKNIHFLEDHPMNTPTKFGSMA